MIVESCKFIGQSSVIAGGCLGAGSAVKSLADSAIQATVLPAVPRLPLLHRALLAHRQAPHVHAAAEHRCLVIVLKIPNSSVSMPAS